MLMLQELLQECGYNLYVFHIQYQKNFTTAQPIKVKFTSDGIVPVDINGYALLSTNKLIFISSDREIHFDLILFRAFHRPFVFVYC